MPLPVYAETFIGRGCSGGGGSGGGAQHATTPEIKEVYSERISLFLP